MALEILKWFGAALRMFSPRYLPECRLNHACYLLAERGADTGGLDGLSEELEFEPTTKQLDRLRRLPKEEGKSGNLLEGITKAAALMGDLRNASRMSCIGRLKRESGLVVAEPASTCSSRR